MTVLYDGELLVHYAFIHLSPPEDELDVLMLRGGQVNGLVAAAQPGVLSLVTGTHTGAVPLVVEAVDGAPPLDDRWEDVVEVSFTTPTRHLWLSTFDEGAEVVLPATGTYRVRYCAVGMDRAHQADARSPDESEVDRYLLQLWPAPAAPDEVVRLGSEAAAYWHAEARKTAPPPPPPTPPTPDELAARRRAEAEERERAERVAVEQHELWLWGGRPPDDQLRHLGPSVAQLARADRDLVDAVLLLAAPPAAGAGGVVGPTVRGARRPGRGLVGERGAGRARPGRPAAPAPVPRRTRGARPAAGRWPDDPGGDGRARGTRARVASARPRGGDGVHRRGGGPRRPGRGGTRHPRPGLAR